VPWKFLSGIELGGCQIIKHILCGGVIFPPPPLVLLVTMRSPKVGVASVAAILWGVSHPYKGV
jgi:hypothetical protein